MRKLYTDSSFDWNITMATKEDVVRGKIAIADERGYKKIEKVAIGKVPGLKQYNNILELTAIARAVELASEEKPKAEELTIYTDSQVAMYWARNKKMNPKIITDAHQSAIEYLRHVCRLFEGKINFEFVFRNQNYAGMLLEVELLKEAPHTI